MADEQRREPVRDQSDDPVEDGVRSDIGASSGGAAPVAPGGDAVEQAEEVAEPVDGDQAPRDPLGDVKHPSRDR